MSELTVALPSTTVPLPTPTRTKRRRNQVDVSDQVIMEVKTGSTTMTDLCRDLPVGETSHREREMQKIDWDAVKRRRIKEQQDMINRLRRKKAGLPEDNDDPENPDDEDGKKKKVKAASAARRAAGPATKIIGDKIVLINDSGLEQVDRHAEGDAEVATLEEVEEDDLTVFFNRATYVNQNRRDPADRVPPRGNDRWTASQNSAFFSGLSMVGTDFSMLSQMVPGKTRRQVKAKFIREERIDPDIIRDALLGRAVPLNFDSYKAATGMTELDFTDPIALQAELDQMRRDHEAEMERDRTDQLRRRDDDHKLDLAPPPRKRSRAKVAGMYGDGEEIVTELAD